MSKPEKRIRIIYPNGSVKLAPYPRSGASAQDAALHAAVEGYYERVPYTQNCWVNEEGLLLRLEENVPGRNEAHKLVPIKHRLEMDLGYQSYAGPVAIIENVPTEKGE